MDGMINIYKESGFTSHDVVAKLRGILKMKKIGHTGTLDPEAVGVLPVCIGKGTKLCDLLADRTKTYQAVLRLGVSTDTEDMTGKVLEEREVSVGEEEVREVILSFVGKQEQIPPMYSALKVNGKKLYELAREGQVIERKARSIEIFDIAIDEIALPLVTFTVSCSKGTYIRSLCRDMGEKLGTLGAMEHLVRTRVGEFLLEDALTLSQVEELAKSNKVLSVVKPVDEAFLQYEAVRPDASFNKLLDNGNSISWEMDAPNHTVVRVYKEDGLFVGLFIYMKNKKVLKPEKLFFCAPASKS